LSGKAIAIIGYGNQGRSQAINLRRAGHRVIVGNVEDQSFRQAKVDGFEALAIDAAAAHADVILFALHMCRGNNDGRWLAEGGYDSILTEIVKRATNFQVYLIEYDDPRSGSFAPLAVVPKDKTVVLGLVSTKQAELEPADSIAKRIDDAARYFLCEQMALSTQCGFNSGVRGNPIGEAAQERKLRLVAQVAHRAWH
jgi:5-methyltetrahydropteroyltriglutamate--homocysteine methyltransferase